MTLREFQVIGRKKPTEADPSPMIYRMRLFAPDKTRVTSRFWYFLSKATKVKRASGEILQIAEIVERGSLKVKNFGILVRYESRSGTHNLYKEFRDVSRVTAVAQLYQDLAARHRARYKSIQIIEVKEIAAADCIRPNVREFLKPDIKFPLPHRVYRAPSRQAYSRFQASRPTTHQG